MVERRSAQKSVDEAEEREEKRKRLLEEQEKMERQAAASVAAAAAAKPTRGEDEEPVKGSEQQAPADKKAVPADEGTRNIPYLSYLFQERFTCRCTCKRFMHIWELNFMYTCYS